VVEVNVCMLIVQLQMPVEAPSINTKTWEGNCTIAM